MRTLLSRHWGLAACVLPFLLVLPETAGASPALSAISAPFAPAPGGNGDSGSAIISPDGRYVLFASAANNLVASQPTNPVSGLVPPILNVFLRDRTNGTTTLVSVGTNGIGGGNGDSWPTGISTNGRYALFESLASNLVPNDTNNAADVFVRDILSGRTILVSAAAAGGVGNGPSRSSVMTPDGQHVAFVSAAANLIASDTNGIPDVFVRNIWTGNNILVSVGTQPTNQFSYSTPALGSSDSPGITPDGRYVVFCSSATNLVSGVTSSGEIYVRDLTAATTTWASVDAQLLAQFILGATNAVSFSPLISTNGQIVAFETATNLLTPSPGRGLLLRYNLQSGLVNIVDENAAVPDSAREDARSIDMTPDGRFIAFVANLAGAASTNSAIYLWDALAEYSYLVSPQTNAFSAANGTCDFPVLNSAGRYVTFLSSAPDLVTNPLSGTFHLYRRDTQSGTTTLVDVDTNATGAGLNPTALPSMSADGRSIAFDSSGLKLVPNSGGPNHDVFARDLTANATELISAHSPVLPSQTGDGSSLLFPGSVSSNGLLVAFASEADNLVPNDTNGYPDVFVRDVLAGTNILVSISTSGISANGFSTSPPSAATAAMSPSPA